MQNSLSVLFLCAGYGSRLKPLTDRTPKPLIKFGGKTSLEINFNQIKALKPTQIICNSHHLHKQIEMEAARLGIESVYEPEILGTAGPLGTLKKTLSKTDYVLVHNGDILHNIPLREIIPDQMGKGIGTLFGTTKSHQNSLCISAEGKLLGIEGYKGFTAGPDLRRLTMTGIALYKKSFLDFCPGHVSDIKEAWEKALKAREEFYVYDSSGYQWRDFGTPRQLWDASRWFYGEMSLRGSIDIPVGTLLKQGVFNEAGWKNCPPGARNLLILEEPENPDIAGLKEGQIPKILGKDFMWEVNNT